MKSTLQRLEEIKRNGYRLDLGEAINDIFENYKKIALLSGAVLLLVAIVASIVFGGFAAFFLGIAALTDTFTDLSEGIPLTSSALIINLVLSIIGYGLFAPITAGIIQMAHNASMKEDFDFGTAFMHFKSVYFKDLFLSAAFITLVGSGTGVAIQLLILNNPDGFHTVGTAISGLISLLVPLFTLVVIPMIIFGKLEAFDAIKGSFIVVSKQVWVIILLAIIFFIFAMLGIIALCIGIIFTVPIFYSMQYIIYQSALPIEENSELDEIGHKFF
jgi:hypothetical protein